MKTIADLKLRLRRCWCALAHPVQEVRGAWRCLRCNPIRPRRVAASTEGHHG